MNEINQDLTRAEKIALGTAFAQEVFDTYPVIESIYIFGSTVRGDNLPMSDLDMHYVVPRGAESLPLEKAQQGYPPPLRSQRPEQRAPASKSRKVFSSVTLLSEVRIVVM